MTIRDHLTRILQDGKPMTDAEMHGLLRRQGLEFAYGSIQEIRKQMHRAGEIIPAAGHASVRPWASAAVNRWKLARLPTTV